MFEHPDPGGPEEGPRGTEAEGDEHASPEPPEGVDEKRSAERGSGVARRFEFAGGCLMVLAVLYLFLWPRPVMWVVLLAILVGSGFWVAALFIPGSDTDVEHWHRSAQVAFLLMALGQVGNLALNQRAQQAAEARNARADSVANARSALADARAEARAVRMDSLANGRALREDSAVVARAENAARLDRERTAKMEAAEAAQRKHLDDAIDNEVAARLAVLLDSLSQIGALAIAPARREDRFYSRAWSAFNRYLAPRARLVEDLRGKGTCVLVAQLANDNPSEPSLRQAVQYLAAVTTDEGMTLRGVDRSMAGDDTMMVWMYLPGSHALQRFPLPKLVEVLHLPRWDRPRVKQ